MDTHNFVYLTIIDLSLILILGAIVPPANAHTISQGDDVYLGECGLDISLAISWPDYTIAWCKSGYAGCLPPDQIIQITGFQHNYCINESLYHPGWYYRWDGNWNSGENFDAFRVRVGTRPVANITPTTTPKPTLAPGIDTRGNGPFTWMVARGDGPDIIFHYNSSSDVCGTGPGNSNAHVWLWGAETTVADRKLITGKNGDYEYEMTAADTESWPVGKYTGYIQFPGINGRQDVFWDPIARCLDTPYDDAVYPDVAVDTRFPVSFRTAFEKVAKDMKYSDDLLVPITMNVVDPSIRITDITQGEDKLFISGVDPDNYALASDKRKHTWTVKATGDIGNERVFATTVPIEMKDMYLGTHELVMTVNKNNYISDVYHNFKITGLYVMPTPTPVLEKYITDMDGNRFVTLVPTQTPTPIPTPVEITQIPTIVSTPEPTPVPTTVPTTIPVPVKTTPNITLPLNPLMGLLALAVAWVIVCRR
jgi:hypothetical protein